MSSVGFCESAQTESAYTRYTIPVIPHHSHIEEGGGFVTTQELRWQMRCQVASAFSFHLSLWGSENKVHNKEIEERKAGEGMGKTEEGQEKGEGRLGTSPLFFSEDSSLCQAKAGGLRQVPSSSIQPPGRILFSERQAITSFMVS